MMNDRLISLILSYFLVFTHNKLHIFLVICMSQHEDYYTAHSL